MDRNELDAARALLGVPSASAGMLPSWDTESTGIDEINDHVSATEEFPFRKRQRSDSAGLDALAALASREQLSMEENRKSLVSFVPAITSSSEEDEEESSMPPPPPRFRRRRSASNPEGMEKWDSCRHFVLPASILESELAEANAAVMEQERAEQEKENDDGDEDDEEEEEEDQVDESTLTPDELLRRARSRLLEDLSEGSINGEKGVLTLPHALTKYKEVYNKNGRIGIYTPAERSAIIARFNRKRTRRVWNKKIRYNCRKSLADRRLRVKGRFVKRSEQEQMRRKLQAEKEAAEQPPAQADDMSDVTDPGFEPTEDQPYRRVRRYTYG